MTDERAIRRDADDGVMTQRSPLDLPAFAAAAGTGLAMVFVVLFNK
jgi:hypothetical protein